MSHGWEPRDPPVAGMKPGDVFSKVVLWVRDSLKGLHEHMHKPPLEVQLSTTAPPSPQDGDIYYADGTNWNPGGGRGLYFYKVSTWVKIV